MLGVITLRVARQRKSHPGGRPKFDASLAWLVHQRSVTMRVMLQATPTQRRQGLVLEGHGSVASPRGTGRVGSSYRISPAEAVAASPTVAEAWSPSPRGPRARRPPAAGLDPARSQLLLDEQDMELPSNAKAFSEEINAQCILVGG